MFKSVSKFSIGALLALLVGALALGPQPARAAVTGVPARPLTLPVKALSTSNLTLSGAQTIDGVAVVAGDLVGAVGQSDNKSGAYIVKSGAWTAADPGVGTGLQLYALNGSTNGNTIYGCDTTGSITWGTTGVTFTKKTSTGASFDPASPGTIGGTTPGIIKSTTLHASSQATGVIAGTVGLTPAFDIAGTAVAGVRIYGESGSGSPVSIRNLSTTTTASVSVDYVVVSLADNATFDYDNQSHAGFVTLTSGGTIGGTLYFNTSAVTTLGGLAPTNLTATLTSSSKINVGASGGKVRIENKTGGTVVILAQFVQTVSS